MDSNKARALIRGGKKFPNIMGTVMFNQTSVGVLVTCEVSGLPIKDDRCGSGFFAFHLHEGISCTENEAYEFADAKMHFNPSDCPHPYHAGDFPQLLSNGGFAYLQFITERINVEEIIGRTVIIHYGSDDFVSQPSGNAGEKIACGVIEKL